MFFLISEKDSVLSSTEAMRNIEDMKKSGGDVTVIFTKYLDHSAAIFWNLFKIISAAKFYAQ